MLLFLFGCVSMILKGVKMEKNAILSNFNAILSYCKQDIFGV